MSLCLIPSEFSVQLGGVVNLPPGTRVAEEVKAGQRWAIQLFWPPFLRCRDNSSKER